MRYQYCMSKAFVHACTNYELNMVAVCSYGLTRAHAWKNLTHKALHSSLFNCLLLHVQQHWRSCVPVKWRWPKNIAYRANNTTWLPSLTTISNHISSGTGLEQTTCFGSNFLHRVKVYCNEHQLGVWEPQNYVPHFNRDYYPVHACAKGLRKWFRSSVSLSVTPVKMLKSEYRQG